MIIHTKRGRGLINKVLNKLPFELHIPGYNYCGPGTKLAARLARGDKPINQLDAACKDHDIVYSKNRENIAVRNAADRLLADKAWQRVFAKDSSFGEKAAAYGVTNVMNLKSKLGLGLKKRGSRKKKRCKRKMTSFSAIMKEASKSTGNSPKSMISSALKIAKRAIKNVGGKKNIKIPRILPVSSKIGGILPLLPLFAGLSATGSLAGGAAGIYKALNQAKSARQQLAENKRHNETMEAIALGKGLYLKPYKTGLGLYLKPFSGQGLKKKKKLEVSLPDRALTNFDILEYAKKLKIPHFRGVYMRDALPSSGPNYHESAIVNLDNSNGPGTHWVAYKKVVKK